MPKEVLSLPAAVLSLEKNIRMHTHAHTCTHTSTRTWRDAVTKMSYQQNPLMCMLSLPILLIHKHSTFFFSLHSPGLIQFKVQTELIINQVIYWKRLLWNLYLLCWKIFEISGLTDSVTQTETTLLMLTCSSGFVSRLLDQNSSAMQIL